MITVRITGPQGSGNSTLAKQIAATAMATGHGFRLVDNDHEEAVGSPTKQGTAIVYIVVEQES